MIILRLVVTLILITPLLCQGNEGFWLPIQLKRLQGVDLQKMGLHLTPEEIYSINSSSLKDAVVSFNGTCSAEIISKAGLLITNHHCGYQAIQEAGRDSSQDFLEKGFWANSYDDEIPNGDAKVSFLVRIEDVTNEVIGQLANGITEKEREERIDELSKSIVKNETRGTHYNAVVKSFFSGNEYYLFIYNTYDDVRLVGAPPESIGRFGGEKDNWEWPRHTGDFALFRVYTGPHGTPSEYNSENIPLKSSYHLPISLDGVQEGDFTMVMGYPSSTKRNLTSHDLNFLIENTIPFKLNITHCKKEVLETCVAINPDVKLGYSSIHAELSNLTKYYQGQLEQVKQFEIIQQKENIEERLELWSNQHDGSDENYPSLSQNILNTNLKRKRYDLYNVYLLEAVFGSEILLFTYHFSGLNKPLADKYPPSAYEEKLNELEILAHKHFKNYLPEVDQQMTAKLMSLFYNEVPLDQHPEVLQRLNKKYKGNFNKWSAKLFDRSIFSDPEKVKEFLSNPQLNTLTKDPAYKLMRGFLKHYYGNIASELKECNRQLNDAHRKWTQGLREMQSERDHYSDANGTLRISFGKVLGYQTLDGKLPFQTTLSGLINKYQTQSTCYQIPKKLNQLYQAKDYGLYGENGVMPVAFITDNDISGGNSGSPVLDSNGALLGIVFDGNRESLSGDFSFDGRYQRSINVDIRYVLFIIDQFAGAKHLIEEMTLKKGDPDWSEAQLPTKILHKQHK